ncbi:MAG: alpha/beta hydrolase-fold protein [Parvibaculaceae bacterium]|nr:alpha/beta hydrolase-fold protein [Parvibaculaceae bacterium]
MIHHRAIRRKEGMLQDVGNGYLVTDVQQYNTTGPAGGYEIFVVLPAASPPPEGYPVLYLLDGNACIAGAADALRFQAKFHEEARIEPLMIVAVGYPGAAPFDMGRRAYDYLPAHKSRKLGDRFMQGAPWHQPGGADDFLDFLSGPLRTSLAARYPINTGRQILCGASFGGFFTLYALLTRPPVIQQICRRQPLVVVGRQPADKGRPGDGPKPAP